MKGVQNELLRNTIENSAIENKEVLIEKIIDLMDVLIRPAPNDSLIYLLWAIATGDGQDTGLLEGWGFSAEAAAKIGAIFTVVCGGYSKDDTQEIIKLINKRLE